MWSQTDYNRLMKPWLQEHYTEMYLRQNDRKSVVGERFIRILKKKKNVYTGKSDDAVDTYSNNLLAKSK